MRRFTDGAGESWDVTTGKESWGTQVLLFSPRSGGGPRTAVLAVETALEASRLLEAMTDEELRSLLAASAPWG
ncbi:MAG TPA: hypothetical protein VMM18_08755 [Gemmatimonadaceae bacterium]|nr:hypothetical protein [Gemmatimonadaceae bacterium]